VWPGYHPHLSLRHRGAHNVGENPNPPAHAEKYDPSHPSATWTNVASLNTPRYYLGATSGPCPGELAKTCLYAIGGALGTDFLPYVEMYDPSSANPAWTNVASLNTPSANMGATSGPCRTDITKTCLYAIGGDAAPYPGQAIDSVEMYDPLIDPFMRSNVRRMSDFIVAFPFSEDKGYLSCCELAREPQQK
jgi:Kelch motif